MIAAVVLILSLGGLASHARAQAAPGGPPSAGDPLLDKRTEWWVSNHRINDAIKLAQIDSVIGLAEQTLRLADQEFGADDPDTLTSVNNLGYLYGEQGRYADAERFFLRALEARERVLGKENSYTLTSVNNLASIYERQGRYADAEPLFVRSLEANERNKLYKDEPSVLDSLNNLASLYVHQGRYAEAEPLWVRVLEARESMFGKDDADTLTSVNNLGAGYWSQGRYSKAEPLWVRALEGNERVLGKEHRITLNSVNNLAMLYLNQGRYADSELLFVRALEARERLLGREHPDTLISIDNLAGNYERQGRVTDAERLHARVLEARERVLGKNHPYTIFTYSGRAANLLNDPLLAPLAIGPARAMLAAVRTRRGELNSSAFAEAQHAREGGVQASNFSLFVEAAWRTAEQGSEHRQGIESEAFTALQDAISGTTARAVNQMAVRRTAEGQAAGLGMLVRQRQDLADRWDANANLFAKQAADTDADAATRRTVVATERARIDREMDRVDARLRTEFPDYFALVRPEPLNVAATQKLLDADEAILLAVQSKFGTHVIAISKSEIKWTRSSWSSEQVVAAVNRLLWDVGVDIAVPAGVSAQWEREGGAGYSYDRKTAYALYQQIVEPVANVLAHKRHVFIATGGVLSSLPFGILVTTPPHGADGDPQALRDTKWFADAHALVVIPSIQSLQYLRKAADRKDSKPAATRSAFAGYGDPALDGQAQSRGAKSGRTKAARSMFQPGLSRSGAGMVNIAELRSLARLPGTATELEDMRMALGAPSSAVHLQQQDTEAAIRSADLSNVRILVLATHGLMTGELTGAAEPGLVFTPPAQASAMDDGYLATSEVSAMKLNADWVILSACNTAAGDGSEGAPGLSGLARAFFYAGARNLLVSHWPVRDDVASRLTVDTIKRQQADPKLSRAEAFQEAMRTIRNDTAGDTEVDSWAHPNAWGPFSLIGDGAH